MTSAFDEIKDQLLKSIGSNIIYATLLAQAKCSCTKMYQHQSSDIQPPAETKIPPNHIPVSHYRSHESRGNLASKTQKANISPRPRAKANDTETQLQNEAPRSRSQKTNKAINSEEQVKNADEPSSSSRDPATSFKSVVVLTCILFNAHRLA